MILALQGPIGVAKTTKPWASSDGFPLVASNKRVGYGKDSLGISDVGI